MYNYIEKNVIPADKVRANKDSYIVENRLLYHLWSTKSRGRLYQQLCIPKKLRRYVLSALHDSVLTGHKSVFKMIEDAIKLIWWGSLYKDIFQL